MTDETIEGAAELLRVAGIAQAADELLDIEALAHERRLSVPALLQLVEQLERKGLLFSGLDEGLKPILRNSGSQYLKRRGNVPCHVLNFLPRTIDDLFAREALIHAGTTLVDEFRYQLLDGDAVEHTKQLVPAAFVQAVNDQLALDLYAAMIALMVRLSDERPAGCVAEEILAVSLIEEAKTYIDMRSEDEEMSEGEMATAKQALQDLFELFEDDDVLDLFEMSEPGDAAVAGHDPIKRELGVVDQRLESWFTPFNWAIPTGHLGD